MIDLLYYATIYCEVCKYIQELEPNMLKYELVWKRQSLLRETAWSIRIARFSHGVPTVLLITTIH